MAKVTSDTYIFKQGASFSHRNLRRLPSSVLHVISKTSGSHRHFHRHINFDKTVGGFVEATAFAGKHTYIGPNALVLSKAKVYGSAWVYENAKIFGSAQVLDHAHISGSVQVKGNARVSGSTHLDRGIIFGKDANLCTAYKFDTQKSITKWLKEEKELVDKLGLVSLP